MPATGDDARPDIVARACGARLREARLGLGLARADVARELRIREAWLAAIEEGRLDRLPGALMRPEFIESYADRLGLDGASFAARLGQAAGAAEGRRGPGTFLLDAEGRLSAYRLFPIAAILAVAAGGGWYLAADSGVPADRAVPSPERQDVLPEERPGAGDGNRAQPKEAAHGNDTRATGGAGMPVLVPAAPVAGAAVGEPAATRLEAGSPMPGPSAGPGAVRRDGGEVTEPFPKSGERVREVQRALTGLGYEPGPIDGLMGPRTRAAVRAYQEASGLTADGTLTPELEREILASSAATGS